MSADGRSECQWPVPAVWTPAMVVYSTASDPVMSQWSVQEPPLVIDVGWFESAVS